MYCPPPQDKLSPDTIDSDSFFEDTASFPELPLEKYFLNKIKGFSPVLCKEICLIAGINGKTQLAQIDGVKLTALKNALAKILDRIVNSEFSPCISYSEGGMPLDFHCLSLEQFIEKKCLDSINRAIDEYYNEKARTERLKNKTSDIVKLLTNHIERCRKKLSIYEQNLKDCEDNEKLQLYGELIIANIYSVEKNLKSVSLMNYYSEDMSYIDVPLDENLLPQENAQRYFRQYAKSKNTYIHTMDQKEHTVKELEYLEGVLQMLENCHSVQEIEEVRQELADQGYITQRKKSGGKKNSKHSLPFHYQSTDGFDIYVGKNNLQNDLLTLKSSASTDMWLHTKNIPGSHVVIKKLGRDIPDRTLLEAATLAALHSKAKNSSNVPVDYTLVKNVKKPAGAKPGKVIYENYRTIGVTPDEALRKNLIKND